MSRVIKFYFDPISPYAYFAKEAMKRTFPKDVLKNNIVYKPVLFAGLLNHHKQLGPAEIELKRIFTYEYTSWVAHKHGYPFKFPLNHPFNPLPLLRGCIAAKSTSEAVDDILQFVWKDGKPATKEFEKDLLHLFETKYNVKPEDFSSADVKNELRSNGEEAVKEGVFGVPTLLMSRDSETKLFWGNDSVPMALEWWNGDDFFKTSEFQKVTKITPAATRKH